MSQRHRLSGAQYKKRRLEKEQAEKQQQFSLDKYLCSKSTKVDSIGLVVEPTHSIVDNSEPLASGSSLQTGSLQTVFEDQVNDDHQSIDPVKFVGTETSPITASEPFIDSDPGNWPNQITDTLRTTLVERGPPQPITDLHKCPKDSNNRRFTSHHYTYKLCNGEIVERKWLVYSKTKNVVFCFCCKLFSNSKTALVENGYNNWRHISDMLHSHSSSQAHLESQKKWVELSIRLKSGNTIDANTQKKLNVETQYWKDVLERLIAIIQFLAQQCLPLRGSSDTLYKVDNGNFLKLVELMGRFDTVLGEHIKRTVHGDNKRHHYLGKRIQNEIIDILHNQVKNKIVSMLKTAKYYSIILDCTPDISGVEQMTIVVRFVRMDSTEEDINVTEHFLGFVPLVNTTGLGLLEVILETLKEMNIPLEDMRGQGYDNGSNMKGKNIGLQKRILDINPRAFYVPCSSHSLNLVVQDAAMSSRFAVNFFCLVKRIYDFFSASTRRWDVLLNHVSNLTLKPLCPTRWESRLDAITPFRYQIGEVYDALTDIHENSTDQTVAHEAGCLANLLCDFTFVCSVVIWYDILLHINVVSKTLQNISVDVANAVHLIEKTHDYFKSSRNDHKFQGYLVDSREVASQLPISPKDQKIKATMQVRNRKKKRQFDYEGEDEAIQNPETSYKVDFYFKIMDIVITALSDRFEQIKSLNEHFDFLYDIHKVNDMTPELLMEKCETLSRVLTHGESKDVNSKDLMDEIKVLATLVKPNTSPLGTLKFISKIDFAPNVGVALRILLTLPVTVASGERSFSKLKLIKTYLRSTMSQTRLTGLATLSIEHQIAATLDYSETIKDFANAKARKISFQ